MNATIPIVINQAFEKSFLSVWQQYRIVLFSAPCGFGKTTVSKILLYDESPAIQSCMEAAFLLEDIPEGTSVIIDDLQWIDTQQQERLLYLLKERKDLKFLLLSRGCEPGWLMPFSLVGAMYTFETNSFFLQKKDIQSIMELGGISLSPKKLDTVTNITMGYPIAVYLLQKCIGLTGHCGQAEFDKVLNEIYIYFDEMILSRFEVGVQRLLVILAPFDPFDIELAKIISGEPQVGKLLANIAQDANMLTQKNGGTYRFWPVFRSFLVWKFDQMFTREQEQSLYSRAALHYELKMEVRPALDCYLKAGELNRVSELLEKNAERHPGIGNYHELEDYYFSLPDKEVEKSAALICAMSMLSAMCMDYIASEKWYQMLYKRLHLVKKGEAEYKNIESKLLYLDIALPQRGSYGIIELVTKALRAMSNKQFKLQSFSVTSMLPSVMNGGKDFCDWSKQDEFLYATIGKTLQIVLGKDGIGLPECAICESQFEKGKDISNRMLTLMSKMGEIQAQGTLDIEFAVIGLLAKIQVSQGKANTALETIENFKDKIIRLGEQRFLQNLDSMICRIQLFENDHKSAARWLENYHVNEKLRFRAWFRYQYITKALVQISHAEYEKALLTLAPLIPYCEKCHRTMDQITTYALMAIAHDGLQHREATIAFMRAYELAKEFQFIWPIAQYGAAILPLVKGCCNEDDAYAKRLLESTKLQAINYPRYLKFETKITEPLSTTETVVLKLLCQNLSNNEIGDLLEIKLPTVKTHVSHILQKLGVKRRSEVKDVAKKNHLI